MAQAQVFVFYSLAQCSLRHTEVESTSPIDCGEDITFSHVTTNMLVEHSEGKTDGWGSAGDDDDDEFENLMASTHITTVGTEGDAPHTDAPATKPSSNVKEQPVHTRLIICVDGTWMNMDGIKDKFTGNITNVYRIWASIQEGLVEADDGRVFNQKKLYRDGLGWGAAFLHKYLNGVLGKDFATQIKEVYSLCCEHLTSPDDELFLFGHSRGAFVVRAVAGLIHHMRLLKAKPGTPEFDQAYRQSLELYRSVRFGSVHQKAKIHHHFTTSTTQRSPPIIKFVGALDTVKAVIDNHLFDISWVDSIRHFRHALAMNEMREAYAPERCTPGDMVNGRSHTFIEAWFLGSHADIGGSCERDGLALYPFQWLMTEARRIGLVVGFETLADPLDTIDSPLAIVYPMDDPTAGTSRAHLFEYANGIQVRLHDFREVHRLDNYDGQYRIKINRTTGPKYVFTLKRRKLFENDLLVGYHENKPVGTIIHPSVYMMFDSHPSIYLNAQSWGCRREVQLFRDKVVDNEENIFWDGAPLDTGSDLKAIRILVCGNAGVGKSTVVNKVFGVTVTEESARAHGQHDIERAFSSENTPGILIHDSRGFQTGDVDEVAKVQAFLRSRSTSPDITERLHAIWYCTLTTRKRPIETSDRIFFETMAKCASEVPIIVVGTQIDEFVSQRQGQYFTELQSTRPSQAQLLAALAEMPNKVNSEVKALQETMENELRTIENAKFDALVLVSKDDEASIRRLEATTLECLDNEYVRKLYVAAQVCDVDHKIDAAVTEAMRLYGHSTRTAAIPLTGSGLAATSTVSVILCRNLLTCFGYPFVDAEMLSQTLHNLVWASMDSTFIQIGATVVDSVAEGLIASGMAINPASWAIIGSVFVAHLASIPASARVILMCTCDIILTLERAFWYHKQIGPDEIRSAAEEYRGKYAEVHKDVKTLVPIMGFIKSFQSAKVRVGIEEIIQKHRYKAY